MSSNMIVDGSYRKGNVARRDFAIEPSLRLQGRDAVTSKRIQAHGHIVPVLIAQVTRAHVPVQSERAMSNVKRHGTQEGNQRTQTL